MCLGGWDEGGKVRFGRKERMGWHDEGTGCEEVTMVSIMSLGFSFVLASYKPLPKPATELQ